MAKQGKSKKTGKNLPKEPRIERTPVETGGYVKASETEGTKSTSAQQNAVQAGVPAGEGKNQVIQFIKSHFSFYTIAILVIIAIMFYIRAVPSYSSVFTNWPWFNGGTYVNVDASDSVYTMRLVYNTIAHFPDRIMYDPFTNFPYGSQIHMGPLYTIMVAFTAIVVGLGHPSSQLIAVVGAYFPAVIGALFAIPTYYLGKKLFGRNTGLLAAFVMAFLPGQFLFRSMLGFTDHHVNEVLFTVATIAFLVYALDAAKNSGLSFEQIKNRDFKALKEPILFSVLAGIAFGCYLLSWPAALLIAFMLFVYFIIQCIVDHINGNSLDYVPIVASILFIVPAIMVLPYSLTWLSFQLVYYSITQPFILGMAVGGIWLVYAVSGVLRQNKVDKWAYPLTLAGIAIVGTLFIYIALPWLYDLLMAGINHFYNVGGGGRTIAETIPSYIDSTTGQISLIGFWVSYDWTFPIFIVGMFMLAYRVYRDRRPAELMFLVWNLFMFVATLVEVRFNYYFAVNTALLTGYFAMAVFDLAGGPKFKENIGKNVKSLDDLPKFIKKYKGQTVVMSILAVIFILIAIWPATSLGQNITWLQASGGTSMPYEWYDALYWMNNHTPDPQGSPVQSTFDYANGTYQRSTSADGKYSYPSSAYGVMSWWDYGHDIEYVAHRAPNANPFQDGVVENNNTLGAAPFFTSTNETDSLRIMNALGSRYVVIDNQMATGKFPAIQQWVNDTQGWEALNQSNYVFIDQTQGSLMGVNSQVPILQDTAKWNNSIMNRLYYDDADGMSHYRLVYESAGPYYMNLRIVDRQQGYIGFTNPPISNDNLSQLDRVYKLYSSYVVAADQQATKYGYGARPPVKYVKIYEKVKGATLTGSAPDGTSVTASLTLKNDDGREFTYTANDVAHNGAYSITVPYPTEAMKGDGYSYGVTPEGKYSISYGNTTKNVDVSESAVMNGGIVQVT